MADLFEGAPKSWIQSFGDNAHEYLDKDVMEWLHYHTVKQQKIRAEAIKKAQGEQAMRDMMARINDPNYVPEKSALEKYKGWFDRNLPNPDIEERMSDEERKAKIIAMIEQGNRNIFADHPGYATSLAGAPESSLSQSGIELPSRTGNLDGVSSIVDRSPKSLSDSLADELYRFRSGYRDPNGYR